MKETTRQKVRTCLECELDSLGAGEPIEDPQSDHHLKVFLVTDKGGRITATSRRVGPDGHHDVVEFLAVVDVNLQSDEYLVAQCLQTFFDEEIPIDDSGCLDPEWPVDPSILVEAHEEAWERHCIQWINDWVEDALTQIARRDPDYND